MKPNHVLEDSPEAKPNERTEAQQQLELWNLGLRCTPSHVAQIDMFRNNLTNTAPVPQKGIGSPSTDRLDDVWVNASP